MTNIAGISQTAVTVPTAAEEASAAADLNFDTFLKLLTTQLQNQDPLDPMDSAEFTSQIAEFSAIEQQVQTNKHLEKLVESDTFGAQSLAVSYIGKEALVPGDKANLIEGEMDFTYTTEKRALTSEIKIVDSSGSIIKTLIGDLNKGTHEITWDGRNEAGELQEDGNYTVFIESAGVDGNIVPAKIFSFAEIYAMEAEDENINLVTTDGRTVNFNSVLQVRASKDEEVL